MSSEPHTLEVDAAVEAIVYGVYDSGALYDPHRWWPRSYLPYSPLFATDLHGRWLRQWREIPDRTETPYARSAAIWVLLAMASRSLKAMFEMEERMSVFLALLEDIRAAKFGDPFCRDGRHLVLEPEKAQEIVDGLEFADAKERSVDRQYSALNATLLAYSEAVFFSANCTVREVHGPYAVNHDGVPAQLLIRDYYKLRDAVLEPETSGLDVDAVRTYSLYAETIRFEFTVLNDYTNDRPLGSAAIGHAVEVTGRGGGGAQAVEGVAAVADLTAALGTTIASVGERIAQTEADEETVEIVRRTYYRASPIAAAVSEGWEPHPQFVEGLRAGLKGFDPALPPPMSREEFGALVDPRT